MFECQKLVLVGDPKQLSPTIQGSEPQHQAGLEQTMFDRLMKMGHDPVMLRTQYRCHPQISAIANRLFYENKLINGISEHDRVPLTDSLPTLCFYNVFKGKERAGSDGSYYNEQEAKFVVFLIECFLESGILPAQIGVITLYKSQLRQVSHSLSESKACPQVELKAIQVSTVDAFQGGEKDVIILSCVRTEHVGFIDCYRRTNVALTRAKRHLFIVGNLRMLSGNDVWGKVISYCKEVPGGVVSSLAFRDKWTKKQTSPVDDAQSSETSSGGSKQGGNGEPKPHIRNKSKDSTITFSNQESSAPAENCHLLQSDDAADDCIVHNDDGDDKDGGGDDDDDHNVEGDPDDERVDDGSSSIISCDRFVDERNAASCATSGNNPINAPGKSQKSNEDSDDEELPIFDIMSLKNS